MQLSTITTAPSTMMPKSSAPRLIKFALTFCCTMPVKVNSMAKGMTAAVINAARKLPKNTNSTAITSAAPSSKFACTVAIALSTKCVRSYTVTARTPLGRLRLISFIRLSTACDTVRLFCPISMNTVPSTVSSPLSVTAPVRNSRPIPTSAKSRTRTGTPASFLTITSRISSTVRS